MDTNGKVAVDKYYRDLEIEYMKLREKIKNLTDAKEAYAAEIRSTEIERLKRRLAEVPPEKE